MTRISEHFPGTLEAEASLRPSDPSKTLQSLGTIVQIYPFRLHLEVPMHHPLGLSEHTFWPVSSPEVQLQREAS
jgi:hypothetical protein